MKNAKPTSARLVAGLNFVLVLTFFADLEERQRPMDEAKSEYEHFELHRLVDGLIYQFDRMPNQNGEMAYRRRDKNLWITYKNEFGWVAWDESSQSLAGRPWNVLPRAQIPDHPPEGEWVSKKDSKTYVYELKFLPAVSDV